MSAFDLYSEYYNLLYREKDYQGESDYIAAQIRKFHPAAKTLVDIGCGTGKHAALLAKTGYAVEGVDMSATMLQQARTDFPAIPFHQGDARTVRLGRKFDVVTSLFHVASYQTANADLDAYLATAKSHLAPGGIFIFDFWYGPGVLSDPPVVRTKRLENDKINLLRIAEPTLYPNRNVVNVHYHVMAKRQGGSVVQEIFEDHAMRYFFAPELDYALSANGMAARTLCEWMSDRAPGMKSWAACIVAGEK